MIISDAVVSFGNPVAAVLGFVPKSARAGRRERGLGYDSIVL